MPASCIGHTTPVGSARAAWAAAIANAARQSQIGRLKDPRFPVSLLTFDQDIVEQHQTNIGASWGLFHGAARRR